LLDQRLAQGHSETVIESFDVPCSYADSVASRAVPTGAGLVAVVAECGPPASEVLDRVREVLLAVDHTAQHGWPADDAVWRTELPAWLVAFCAPEETPEEAARWLA
jgi:hypothetical protein